MLRVLLQEAGLDHYLQVLLCEGVDDLDTLAAFSAEELLDIGVIPFGAAKKLTVLASRRSATGLSPDDAGRLHPFLCREDVRLPQLADCLEDCGLDCILAVAHCTEAELAQVGVSKAGHRKRLLLRASEVVGPRSSSPHLLELTMRTSPSLQPSPSLAPRSTCSTMQRSPHRMSRRDANPSQELLRKDPTMPVPAGADVSMLRRIPYASSRAGDGLRCYTSSSSALQEEGVSLCAESSVCGSLDAGAWELRQDQQAMLARLQSIVTREPSSSAVSNAGQPSSNHRAAPTGGRPRRSHRNRRVLAAAAAAGEGAHNPERRFSSSSHSMPHNRQIPSGGIHPLPTPSQRARKAQSREPQQEVVLTGIPRTLSCPSYGTREGSNPHQQDRHASEVSLHLPCPSAWQPSAASAAAPAAAGGPGAGAGMLSPHTVESESSDYGAGCSVPMSRSTTAQMAHSMACPMQAPLNASMHAQYNPAGPSMSLMTIDVPPPNMLMSSGLPTFETDQGGMPSMPTGAPPLLQGGAADTNYEEVEELGSGAFGRVIKSVGDKGGIFAIKNIQVSNAAARRDAEKEFQMLKKLDHNNIVRVLDYFVRDDTIGIVMEYMAAGSIQRVMEDTQGGYLQEGAVRNYTFQTIQGLQYLHNKNIVHSDLKPRNLLVGQHGEVKLTDFGLSRAVQRPRMLDECDAQPETRSPIVASGEDHPMLGLSHGTVTGTTGPSGLRGTVMYMSPKLIRQETDHSFQTDIWALGCTVLEMATGRAPWHERGFTMEAQYIQHLSKAGVSTSGDHSFPQIAPHLSEPLKGFIRLCFDAEFVGTRCHDLTQHPFLSKVHVEIAALIQDDVV